MELTADRLREVLAYDAETGAFTRRGKVVGTKRHDGYILICIDYTLYLAHRLAWLYVTGEWPKGDIDHANRKTGDNRFENLRESTRSENLHNAKRPTHNTSGLKGASYMRDKRKWRATISIKRKCIHLGLFDTAEEAHAAYMKAAQDRFGDFACSGGAVKERTP